MLNKVILIGRLANDPELKYTPSGIAVTTFRIAVDRPISAEARQQGREKEADFIDIVAWRQAAEFASNYLGKGRLVAVDGRLQIRQYVAQDGTNRRVAEVVVDQLKSLERPRDTEGGEAGGGQYNRQSQGAPGGGGSGGGYNRAGNGGGGNVNGSGGAMEADDPGYGDEPPARPAANRAAAPAQAAAPQRGNQGGYGGGSSGGGGGYNRGAAPAGGGKAPGGDASAEIDPFADDLDDPFADE